jgi:2-polyprenyl-6-hydroxyphenyl methylase/3-demethylubiquinone-9 3-methyltransferase
MSPQSAAAPLSSEVQKFDALAHEFWDPRGAFHPLHALNPVRLDYIAQRTELSQRRVADIGCGGGLLAEGLARHGAQVCGIDLAPNMIEVARLRADCRSITGCARPRSSHAAAPEPSMPSPAWN